MIYNLAPLSLVSFSFAGRIWSPYGLATVSLACNSTTIFTQVLTASWTLYTTPPIGVPQGGSFLLTITNVNNPGVCVGNCIVEIDIVSISISTYAICAAGSYYSTSSLTCVLCPSGTFSSSSGAVSTCKTCLGYNSLTVGATVCSNPIIGTPFAASYTGSNQYYTVPASSVSVLKLQMWGGGGGGGFYSQINNPNFGGGASGYTQCYVSVSSSQVLQIIVGGAGQSAAAGTNTPGGFGGGGSGRTFDIYSMLGSGGGRSAVQVLGYLTSGVAFLR